MALIKVSDYVSRFLVENGVRHLFLIGGGGMMHLLDSVGKQEGLQCIYNLNEQASGICAESYAQFTNHLGAALLTTGPGATNAITGCAGAWLDSTPVLYISGQCKRSQMGQLMGLRQYGAQEIAIIPVVRPITKYAEIVMEKEDIRYQLEKAVYLATHGRRGPVWLDIPLDIQGASVEEDSLRGFDAASEGLDSLPAVSEEDIREIYEDLNRSKRPVIMLGHGAVAGGLAGKVKDFCHRHSIPAMTSWRAKGLFSDDDPLYMGSPGAPTLRFSNYAVQNCDFLLVVGSRLNPPMTNYGEERFAPGAVKYIVDIEEGEMDKLAIPFKKRILSDAGIFIGRFLDNEGLMAEKDRSQWTDYCKKIKDKYPLSAEKQPVYNEGKVDGYYLAQTMSDFSRAEDIFVGSSSGRTCGISHMAYQLKEGQKFVTSMGLGSMGWVLPSAIACCIAGGRRTVLLEGDGSLQHNIQELALIKTYGLPIKLFVFQNGGYASILTMQRNNFQSRFAGCTPESGLGFPELRNVAETYSMDYYEIKNDGEVRDTVERIMADDRPVLCEVHASIYFDEIPKSVTKANADGSFSSSPMEYLYPEISEDEQKENMPEWDD
ncbi:MAG: thiamine pyrophosphate-binding protein [Candidatus Avispirillum sp.]